MSDIHPEFNRLPVPAQISLAQAAANAGNMLMAEVIATMQYTNGEGLNVAAIRSAINAYQRAVNLLRRINLNTPGNGNDDNGAGGTADLPPVVSPSSGDATPTPYPIESSESKPAEQST